MKRIYAVLDIGSTTLKLLVAELMSTNINILFTKKLASHAIEGGLIKNEEVLVDEIRSIIKEADVELNTTITSVALVLPSNYARTYESKGITKVNSPQDKIEISDVVRALKIAQCFEKSKKEEIVSTIPVKYRLDTKEVDRMPLGLRSASLKVETLVITTSKKVLYSYLTAVEKAGLDVIDITIDAYASAKEAFDAAYLQEGAVMINIGHDHSTISFFEEGYLKYLKTIPMGGYTLTAAIADAWQISAVKESDPKEQVAFFSKVLGAYSSIAFIGSSGLIMISKVVMTFMVGKDFFISWRYIPVLTLGTTFGLLATFLASVYMLRLKSRNSMVTTMICAVVNIVLNCILIPVLGNHFGAFWGAMGAGIATFISYFVLFLIRAFDTQKYLKIQWNVKKTIVSVVILFVQALIMTAEVPFWFVLVPALFVLLAAINAREILLSVNKLLRRG